MERNNFEEQLRKVVAQTDQKSNNLMNRERIWGNIDKPTYNKTHWFYAGAVIFILGFSIALILNKNPNNAWVKKEKIESPIVKNNFKLPKQFQNRETGRKTLSLSIAKSKQIYQNSNLKLAAFSDTLIAKNPKKQIDLNLSQQNEVVLVDQKIAGTKTIINESPISQPEFTVQFKRGKKIEATVENQIKITTTFKKLSFGRETSTLVLANTNPNNPFKIKF